MAAQLRRGRPVAGDHPAQLARSCPAAARPSSTSARSAACRSSAAISAWIRSVTTVAARPRLRRSTPRPRAGPTEALDIASIDRRSAIGSAALSRLACWSRASLAARPRARHVRVAAGLRFRCDAARRGSRAGSHLAAWPRPRTASPCRPASTSASRPGAAAPSSPTTRPLQVLEALLDLERDLVPRGQARRIPPPRVQLGSRSWGPCSVMA